MRGQVDLTGQPKAMPFVSCLKALSSTHQQEIKELFSADLEDVAAGKHDAWLQ